MISLKYYSIYSTIMLLALTLLPVNTFANQDCNGNPAGGVIFDNTATSNLKAISSNLVFYGGCGKSASTIETGVGGNAINKTNFHVLSRGNTTGEHTLKLSIGATDNVVDDLLTTDPTNAADLFNAGDHLFDLDRLRATADWLAVNKSTPTKPSGTMELLDFMKHIKAARTMYGVVRVKIGLKRGSRICKNPNENGSPDKGAQFCTNINALGQAVANDTSGVTTVAGKDRIYGFCSRQAGTASFCGTNSPVAGEAATECFPIDGGTSSNETFKNIKDNTEACGITMDSASRLKVQGSLLFDFVDEATGNPIPLEFLPYAPRELYFKITVPIMVNWANADTTGAMKGLGKISAISFNQSTSPLTEATDTSDARYISLNLSTPSNGDIPQESIDAYNYQVSTPLNANAFTALSYPDKYRMLMPSGYAKGWATAFSELNITKLEWSQLPPCGTPPCNYFGVPSGGSDGAVLTEDLIRDSGFEDIPTYLYSGGLIDMHGHVNISGLIYVPQGMELEANTSRDRQYVSGAIVVRDGFFIKASGDSILVISSDPQSYSTAKRNLTTPTEAKFGAEKGGPGEVATNTAASPGVTSAVSPCLGCAGGGGSGGAAPIGNRLWMEIRPQ